MPRYIDADALLEKLQVDFDKQGRKSDDMALRGESELSVKYNHGQYCYLNAMEQVKDTPTADVVPKSEVEKQKLEVWRLQGEVERLKKENETLTIKCNGWHLAAKRVGEDLQNARAEVLEEIESLAKIYTFPVVKNGIVEIVKEPFWCIEPSDFETLKKKYT